MQQSKTERILAIINFFLPHTDLYQYRFEADSIGWYVKIWYTYRGDVIRIIGGRKLK